MKRHTSSVLGAGVALAAAALPLAAQTFTGSVDPVLRRIWEEGTRNSQVERLAQTLTDSLGPRLTGTPETRAAQDWLVSTYRGWGIPARNENYGTWRSWKRGTTHVDLLTPRVRSLEGMMLAWSPGTGGQPVTAPVAILPDVADSAAFQAWLPNARGKFVLMSQPMETCRPDKTWEEFATPASLEAMRNRRREQAAAWQARIRKTGYEPRTLPRALEDAGAAGVMTSLWSGGYGVTRIFQARTHRVPMLDLSCEDYGLVYRLSANGQGPTLRVTAESQDQGELPVANTIARIQGTTKPDEYVVLSAHFDSWDGSSGATDNATGTVVMMEAMRLLQTVFPRPKRTILVGHWNGEEQGLNGSRAFVADNPRVVQGLQALFNQDNGTGRVVNISMQGFSRVSPTMQRWLGRIPTEITQHIELDDPGVPSQGGSDYASFVCKGVPAFGLSSLPWEYGTYTWHTNRDTYDKIVFDDVRSNAILTAMLVYLAAEEPELLPRDRATEFPVNRNTGARYTWPECRDAARSWGQSTR